MQLIEKEIEIKGNRVSYFDEGLNTGTPLLFIHGFPFSKEMWKKQFAVFAETRRVIAYDIRGHGHSVPGSLEFSVAQFAEDLLLFMDALLIEKADVCGLSMGGYIALNAFATDPERITTLILCDTQCNGDSIEAREKRIKTVALIRLNGLRKYADEMVNNLFAPDSFNSKPEEVSFIKDSILHTTPDTVCKTLMALANRKDTCAALAQAKIPVLIMVGSEDKITPPAMSQKMHDLIPNSALEIIDGAGHLSNLENTEMFNTLLARFLKEKMPNAKRTVLSPLSKL